jgi:hypothetical protein
MTKKQITEGNRLITHFMGWELIQTKDELKAWVFKNKETKQVRLLDDTDVYLKKFFNKDSVLEFHKSWDVLLPVYKKLAKELRELSNKIKSHKGCSWVDKQEILKHIDDCDCTIRCEIWGVRIMDTFNGIAETIKWYNEHKNKKQIWVK